MNEIDPAVRAAAEVRAREAGMSLNDWLRHLVHGNAVPSPRPRVYGCGWCLASSAVVPQGLLSSGPTLPATRYDLDTASPVFPARMEFFPVQLESLGGSINRAVRDAKVPEATRSAYRIVTAFPPRISHAAILMSAAFAEADVAFQLPHRRSSMRHTATRRWYHDLVDTCLRQSREVRNALVHHWIPSGRAELLWRDAFVTLCDLTPARHELLVMYCQDRERASAELAKYLDLAEQEFELSAILLADVDSAASAETANERRFSQLRVSLLARAGGGLSLTEGARRLNISRQALHKRVRTGGALGMKDGEEIVLPQVQWIVRGDGKVEFVPGLSKVVRLFDQAGGWSALQFLLDPDPNLGESPIEALRMGKVEAAVSAARAYLGLDEG